MIEQFERRGDVTFFSPLKDAAIPDCNFLYLPGGYPECYLEKLSSNAEMRASVANYVKNDGRALAECGGFMYLGKAIEDADGKKYPMVGSLKVTTSMKQRKLHLGYRNIDIAGERLIGHEFHYSSLVEADVRSVGEITDSRDEKVPTRPVKEGGVLASYLHFYFGADDQFDLIMKWMR